MSRLCRHHLRGPRLRAPDRGASVLIACEGDERNRRRLELVQSRYREVLPARATARIMVASENALGLFGEVGNN